MPTAGKTRKPGRRSAAVQSLITINQSQIKDHFVVPPREMDEQLFLRAAFPHDGVNDEHIADEANDGGHRDPARTEDLLGVEHFGSPLPPPLMSM
jgi:hypothetical protein